MLRHVALFKFVPDVTDSQISALEAGLATLPAAIPAIRRYEFGRDASLADGNHDFAVVADFDDVDGWRAYSTDETHQRVSADHVRPIVDSFVRVQYAV